MLKSKIFLKKTKKGSILKVVREHYLRDDIYCGSEACDECPQKDEVLELRPQNPSSEIFPDPHYIIPDTNVVLHQLDILEDKCMKNAIILQTVLDEVRHRSAPAYKRIKEAISNPDKHFLSFVNEFHKDTYVERQPRETANDRNDRAIRTAAKWFQTHLFNTGVKVILLTNDADNKVKASQDGVTAFTVAEYVGSLKDNPELLDRLAHSKPSNAFDEGVQLPEHVSIAEVQKGLKSGRYLQGSFQASRDNCLEAVVFIQDKEDVTVFLQGNASLNRAVHEDVVAVEMLPEKDWSYPSSLVIEDVEGETEMDKEARKEKLKQPTGKVVAIIKRKWRQYCGMLLPVIIKTATRHLFVPSERRIPKIRIETRQAHILQGQRVIVAIDSWPKNSRYPLGHFVRKLGTIGDKETENEVLLLEHDIPHVPFSTAVLNCLPKLPWLITEEDVKKRTDLRHLHICSVDPPGCTDIDDALHYKPLDNGNVEVGVHIADVTHFIRPGTAIDEEARKRGTTVYLIDKRIDMVPELLSSNLCSLRSNVDRFAFTVIWEMTKEAEIISTRFMKSIINSKASLTYAEAQMKIDDSKQQDELAQSLRGLNTLAKILKQGRTDKGSLSLASPEVRFHIDSETADPIDVVSKELMETNSMVEEFMLLANVSVAKKIYEEFPDCAVLRRHPSPPPSNFKPVINVAEARGFDFCVDSSKDLANSLASAQLTENPYFNTMLRILATRCMMQALYFCSGMLPYAEFHHYGLAAPIYTHFTSPIRRYPDVLVHRLLAVAIQADASFPELLDKKKTQALCNHLNYRHKMAQYAGRASVALHTLLFFKNKVLIEDGYVMFVRKNALTVLIPKYGLEGIVKLAEYQNIMKFDDENTVQTIGDVIIRVFDAVKVEVSVDQSNIQHQHIKFKLVSPQLPEIEEGPPLKKQKKRK
ncbi:exosome complex exonuclease RRP44 [Lingula anatina]|uniref:Protein DIS3 homolog n=1 Tax=Lingula anatina TaxID=7574 RepID=A0A1S3JZT4_LINAN|nr:exosome complex exonuclease RRP44 [Lingula anatina]|eukprot:XP_013415893.1 exosome complex exonuclease RRP44 [Lingula anatina]